MIELTYRLDQFEGPLDLLLTLISKNKVSITDIPIAIICDQYMEYIEEAHKLACHNYKFTCYVKIELLRLFNTSGVPAAHSMPA